MLAHSPISAFPLSAIGFPPIKGAIEAAIKVRSTYKQETASQPTYRPQASQLPQG